MTSPKIMATMLGGDTSRVSGTALALAELESLTRFAPGDAAALEARDHYAEYIRTRLMASRDAALKSLENVIAGNRFVGACVVRARHT